MADRKAPKVKVKLDPESEAWNKLPWRKFEQHVYRIQKSKPVRRVWIPKPGSTARKMAETKKRTYSKCDSILFHQLERWGKGKLSRTVLDWRWGE